jgi:hypothetical protein
MLSRLRETHRSIRQLPEICEAVLRTNGMLRDCSLSPVDRFILASADDVNDGPKLTLRDD